MVRFSSDQEPLLRARRIQEGLGRPPQTDLEAQLAEDALELVFDDTGFPRKQRLPERLLEPSVNCVRKSEIFRHVLRRSHLRA
jgi:hypothetical protein